MTDQYSLILSTKENHIPISSSKPPLWLAIDRVVDPMNLGAILRTCYFMKVDGVVITQHDTAPLSPTVSRASSGALEIIQNFSCTSNLPKFLSTAKENGWKVIGTANQSRNTSRSGIGDNGTILCVGNEGFGLSKAAVKV